MTDDVLAELRAVAADLLGTEADRVDPSRSLISLGFDSLMAITLQHRVQAALGVTISVADLLAGFSIERIAATLAPPERSAPTVRPRPERLPLSHAQQRLWFLDALEPGTGAYTVAGAVRLTGVLDLARLAACLSRVVARHQALRTVFPLDGDTPYQKILPPQRVRLPMTDLSGLAPARAEGQAAVVARQLAQRPFDLATGPVLRAHLVRLSPTVHDLVVAVHHIACDGASMNVMLDELTTLYRGDEPPRLSVQYADYTLWQRDWLAGPRRERQLAYWQSALAGAPPELRLATDRPRRGGAAGPGGAVRHSLPAGLSARLHALSGSAGTTLFMTMAAAFSALLGRLAGQPDVAIGTPVANRADPVLEPLIGFFVNTLALRTDLSGDPSFAALLARTRETTLAAYEHQDLPFEQLVEALGLHREPGRNPLFSAMFTLRPGPLRGYDLPDGAAGRLRAAPRELDPAAAKFDLTLIVEVDGGVLHTRWEYRRDLFDEGTVARFAEHYRTLLTGVVAEPDRPLSTVALVTGETRQRMLHRWNASATMAAGPANTRSPHDDAAAVARVTVDTPLAPESIRRRAAAAPDDVALVTDRETVTYGELDARAGALAAMLRSRGVGPDTLVGLSAQRGLELVVGLLAILRAGGAYLPLDPTYPSARLAAILADAAPPVILTQRHLLTQLPEHTAEMIPLDEPLPPAAPGEPAGLRPGHLAYVLYTSGSTGTPKGVAVTHANLRGFLTAMTALFGRRPQTWLALTSTAFDISVLELVWTLAAGHRVVLLDEENADVAGTIARHGVTHLQTTPSFAARLLAAGAADLSPLDTLLLGGETFPAELVERLRALHSTKVVNGYGPTEATVYATMHPVGPTERDIPIGRPVPGARVYILDRHLEPVPVGVTGELYLAGHGIARGYLGRPALTAQRFLPDPHGAPGSRMYRTGDLARYRADGTIDFLGRTDHQVKIGGYRIELGEIDAVLGRHPAVRAAVTVATDGALVSYVVAQPAVLPLLRTHLRAQLPSWMHPAQLVTLAELPLTANGKVDRARLPAPPRAGKAASVPPQTPAQRRIADIWQAVLGRSGIGAHDNFFDLGGHSLLATQAVSHIRRAFGVDLPLRAIFEHPTVAGLAELTGAGTTGAGP
ncbi:amino acid adenylation domain-containing protein, partial [Actinophytocola sp.]|uniref:amino acid adenylation domain-containing protein n=1 Tax=Actinophytocola sp. TaxID=1872138 RepID=UPI002D7ECD00